MDWIGVKSRIEPVVKKYRYALLVLLAGIVIMLLPVRSQSQKTEDTISMTISEVELEERLSAALSRVSGAGEVSVVLTLAAGEETVYQTNNDLDADAQSNQSKIHTVTVTDAQRNETGLIKQVNPPTYLGAVIVCQGADNPAVRLAIVEAVGKATGLGADKISVLKMK